MSNVKNAALVYIQAWNENDPEIRRRLLDLCWAQDGTITSNTEYIIGRDQVFRAIEAFRRARPEDRAVLTSEIDYHHNLFRFTGKVIRTDGTSYSEILDVGEVDADGRITRILTFLGPLPPPPGSQ